MISLLIRIIRTFANSRLMKSKKVCVDNIISIEKICRFTS